MTQAQKQKQKQETRDYTSAFGSMEQTAIFKRADDNYQKSMAEFTQAKGRVNDLKGTLGEHFEKTQGYLESLKTTWKDGEKKWYQKLAITVGLKKSKGHSLQVMMADLKENYENYNRQLGEEIQESESKLSTLDDHLTELLSVQEQSVAKIDEYKLKAEETFAKKQELEEALAAGTYKGAQLVEKRKEFHAATLAYENAADLLAQENQTYKRAENLYEFNSIFRKEMSNMVTDAKTMHRNTTDILNSLETTFASILGSIKLVETKENQIDTHLVFKNAVNGTVISIADLSRSIGEYAHQVMKQDFFDQDTLDTLKATEQQHSEQIKRHRIENHMEVQEQLQREASE